MTRTIECTFIGHATTLCRMGSTRILTDPHFGNRVAWARRRAPLEFDPASLSDLGTVLISHLHYDHANISSFKFISSAVPIIVPERTEPAIGQLLANPVIELSHWATHELVDGTRITAVPQHHRGGRFSQLRYTASNAYIVERGDMTIFFCGDSAYGPHFSEIGNLYRIDMAILPIGCYAPRWFMKSRHMTPAEAVTAFEDLRAHSMIPIHWGTFRLSWEHPDEPIRWLERIIQDRPDLAERICIAQPGETKRIVVEETQKNTDQQSASATQVFTADEGHTSPAIMH